MQIGVELGFKNKLFVLRPVAHPSVHLHACGVLEYVHLNGVQQDVAHSQRIGMSAAVQPPSGVGIQGQTQVLELVSGGGEIVINGIILARYDAECGTWEEQAERILV